MSETDDEGTETAIDLLERSVDAFTVADDGIHSMTLSGTIGFHAYYSSDPDDPLTAASTAALHTAIKSVTEEIWVDDGLVERKHGEVTPEAIANEIRRQIEEFVGLSPYVCDRLEEEMADYLRDEERQRNHLRTATKDPILDDFTEREGSVESETPDEGADHGP